MGKIQVLDWLVVNKIAAGEVIERPASVVKELVENSVDAESTQIDIHLEDGGKRLIRVTDNGTGISAEDLPTAFLNHATSKIRNVEDIFSIYTMGFRGEALPSIASIAHVTLSSRTREAPYGNKMFVRNGVCSPPQEEGVSYGTQIEVEDLFYNTPVRQKFLKSASTELSYITKMVAQLALAHEGCGFTFTHGNKQIFKVMKDMNFRQRIEILFGKNLVDEAIPVETTADDIQLRAFIGKPSAAKPKSAHLYFFLNGRTIKDKNLSHAFREAYGEFLMPNRFPHGFIFIDMNPEWVDVNVHPTKSEVRFQNPGKIYSLLLNQFKQVLRQSNLAPSVKIPLTSLISASKPFRLEEAPKKENSLPFQQEEMRSSPNSSSPNPLPEVENKKILVEENNLLTEEKKSLRAAPLYNTNLPQQPNAELLSNKTLQYPTGSVPTVSNIPTLNYPTGVHPKRPDHLPASELEQLLQEKKNTTEKNLPEDSKTPPSPQSLSSEKSSSEWYPWGKVFQLHNSYIVEETKTGFHVIDQHALHERILAFKFQDMLKSTEKYVQRLLIPETMELNKSDFLLVLDQKEALEAFGLEIDAFGESTIAVNAVPLLLKDAPIREILQAIVSELRENGEIRKSVEQFREAIIHMMACKAAVKYGQKLSEPELIALLKARFTVEHTHNCPHGRPTTLHFSSHDLDRQFHRH